MPNELSIPLHALVRKFTYVMTAIRPLELPLPFDLRVLHASSVQIHFSHLVNVS